MTVHQIRTLYSCQAQGQVVEGGPLVTCPDPAKIYCFTATGRIYQLCDRHAGIFGDELEPIAHIDGEVNG